MTLTHLITTSYSVTREMCPLYCFSIWAGEVGRSCSLYSINQCDTLAGCSPRIGRVGQVGEADEEDRRRRKGTIPPAGCGIFAAVSGFFERLEALLPGTHEIIQKLGGFFKCT